MKNSKTILTILFSTALLIITSVKLSFSQVQGVDSTQAIPQDTASQQTTTVKTDTATAATKEKSKGKSTLILYAGPNFSTLSVENDLKSKSEAGFHIGLSWRSKGFFYGQGGIRYNNPVYSVFPSIGSDSGDHKFSVSDIDFPITGGINLLSATDRILGLRIFLSAVPAFNLSVGDNDQGISKDSVNTFIFYGQGGIGVDVLFLVVEAGFNYGFTDLIKNVNSKPGQVFVNVGFRF